MQESESSTNDTSEIAQTITALKGLRWWQWFRRGQQKKILMAQLQSSLESIPKYQSTIESIDGQILTTVIYKSLVQSPEKIPTQVLSIGITLAKASLDKSKTLGWLGRWLFNRTQKSEQETLLRLSWEQLKRELVVKEGANLTVLLHTLEKFSSDDIERFLVEDPRNYIKVNSNFRLRHNLSNISSALSESERVLKKMFDGYAKAGLVEGMQNLLATELEFDEMKALQGAAPLAARFLLERHLRKSTHNTADLFRIIIKNGDLQNLEFLMTQRTPDLEEQDFDGEKTLLDYAAESPNPKILECLQKKDNPTEKVAGPVIVSGLSMQQDKRECRK